MTRYWILNKQKFVQKKEIQEDIRHYQAELDKDFFDKYSIEEQKLEQEIEEFLNNKSTFDDEMIQKMPAEWVRFIFALKIPKIRFALLKKE